MIAERGQWCQVLQLWNHCFNTVSLTAGHLLLCMRIPEFAAAAKELEEKFFSLK